MIAYEQFLKKSIATQTGDFEYNISFSVNNTTGNVNFGFSGEEKIFDFSVKSGKLLDYDDKFVYGVNTSETTYISGKCNSGDHNYYINNIPTNLNAGKETGYIDWFYINAEGCEVDFDMYLNGDRPNVDISSVSFAGSNSVGYGTIELISGDGRRQVRVFSGKFRTGTYQFVSFPEGDITGSGQYSAIKSAISGSAETVTGRRTTGAYTLYTNFGTIEDNFEIQVNNALNQTLNLEGTTYLQDTGSIYLTLTYQSLFGDALVSEYLPLDIYLRNVSGSGVYGTGIENGAITSGTGTFTGEWNIITGTISGTHKFNFRNNGWYEIGGTGYSNALLNHAVPNEGQVQIQIERYKDWGLNIHELEISGYNTGISLYISGGRE